VVGRYTGNDVHREVGLPVISGYGGREGGSVASNPAGMNGK